MRAVRVGVMSTVLLVIMGARPTSAGSTLAVFGGADMALSPDIDYSDALDTGYTLGVHYRRPFRSNLCWAAEFSYSHFNNADVALVLPSIYSAEDIYGGDLSRIRLSGGLAHGSGEREGIGYYAKALAGWYRNSVGDTTYTLIDLMGNRTPEVFEGEGSNNFGLNFGGGVEIPVSGSTALFGGLDLDLIFGDLFLVSPGIQGTKTHMTAKGGVAFSFGR